jgi:hypothetical protein
LHAAEVIIVAQADLDAWLKQPAGNRTTRPFVSFGIEQGRILIAITYAWRQGAGSMRQWIGHADTFAEALIMAGNEIARQERK